MGNATALGPSCLGTAQRSLSHRPQRGHDGGTWRRPQKTARMLGSPPPFPAQPWLVYRGLLPREAGQDPPHGPGGHRLHVPGLCPESHASAVARYHGRHGSKSPAGAKTGRGPSASGGEQTHHCNCPGQEGRYREGKSVQGRQKPPGWRHRNDTGPERVAMEKGVGHLAITGSLGSPSVLTPGQGQLEDALRRSGAPEPRRRAGRAGGGPGLQGQGPDTVRPATSPAPQKGSAWKCLFPLPKRQGLSASGMQEPQPGQGGAERGSVQDTGTRGCALGSPCTRGAQLRGKLGAQTGRDTWVSRSPCPRSADPELSHDTC